jgi:hypothetical protein
MTISQKQKLCSFLALFLLFFSSWAEAAEEVTYTITALNTLTTTGTAPVGSSATIEEPFVTSTTIPSGKKQVLTLNGYNGYKITNITLSMKSGEKSGAGKLYYSTDGGTTYSYIIGTSSSYVEFKNVDLSVMVFVFS